MRLKKLGIFSFITTCCGFGMGTSLGVVIGCYLFSYFRPTHLKDVTIRPLVEQDSQTLQRLLPEIPLWIKYPDYDRLDWLNKFIDILWPYLDKAICKTAMNIAKPIITEQIPKHKVEFETFTLGSLPPTFQGIKVYNSDEKELIMEPSLKWAGNPNITVKIKAFGLRGTVQVVDLQVFASPRITLKPLVPSFPCFANVFVSLTEKPHVDFGLKVLGADVMSIPGLYSFVQERIKDRVADMCVWPKAQKVQIMDPKTAMKVAVGIIHVKVVGAVKLRKKDLMGASDPYVKLKLTEDKLASKITSVKYSNLNPQWNEEFSLVVKDPESQVLQLSVYDWEQVSKHERMGMNVIPLKELIPDEPKVVTLDLLKTMDPNDPRNDKSRGHLIVEVLYKAFKDDAELATGEGDVKDDKINNNNNNNNNAIEKAPVGTPSTGGLLVIMIHGAEDVEGKHHTNPYARLIFKGEERRTKRVKKNRDPRWEEEFEFMLEEPPINERLHVEVQSASSKLGLLRPKLENLGFVDINLSDAVTNKRINDKYHLIDSRNGRIQIELQWRTP